MIVKALYRGYRAIGLHVGAQNARRYFSKRIDSIELQLDHLRIVCGLAPEFWLDKPEIQDPRLSLWLQTVQSPKTPCATESNLAMIPTGRNSFRLTSLKEARTSEAEFETGKPGNGALRGHVSATASA